MTTLAELHRVVDATVASNRLGKPVYIRYHLNGLLEKEGASREAGLARTGVALGDWVGQPPRRVYALSSRAEQSTHASLTLEFANGATAVLSHVQGHAQRDGVELMVVGTRGVLYHAYDAGHLHTWEDAAASLGARPSGELLAGIEASAQSRKPAPIREPSPRERPAPPLRPQPGKTEPRYGILLVTGSHTHQENYAAAFAADRRCKLVAVTDEPDIDRRRRQLNERLARALGIPYIDDLEKALQRKDVHVVSICAPPERRGRIAVRCAEAGKHLYLDKSLAPQLAEADAIVGAVKKSRARSHMFSFVPSGWAREAKRLLQAGRCGKLLAVHADTFFAKGKTDTARPALRKEEYPPHRHQLVEAKRELDNVGVYPITLVRWLTGKKFRTVHGLTANYFFAEHQKHNVEDFGLLSCTLEDGTPVTIAAGRYGWTSHPAGGVNRLVLVGSARTLIIDANRPRVEISTNESPWMPPNVNPADPMGFWQSTQDEVHVQPKKAWLPLTPAGSSDASYFLDCLDGDRDSEVSAAEAALATEVLLAGYRSASTGEVVTLPLPRS